MPRPHLLAALASLLPFSACQSEADRYPAVTTGAVVPAVQAVVPLPLPTMRARLLARLASADSTTFPAHPAYGPQFASYELATNDARRIEYLFRRYDLFNSSDETPISTAFHAPATVTSSLLTYLALPAAARAQDVYLNPTQRWATADYRDTQGQPLPYTCGYILHLTAATAESTRLQLLAIDSNVVDGTKFGWQTARDGLGVPWPGQVPRYRDVVPSLTDQQQMLAQLLKLAQPEE